MLRSSGANGAGNLQRRIVLLVLSGDPGRVREILKRDYPQHFITELSRVDFEKRRSLLGRLELVRAHHPDLFVVSTERLGFQRGQNTFLLFGALAGAKHSAIMDAYGGWRQARRTSVLTTAPVRLAYEAALSATAIARARRDLMRLERAVATLPGANPDNHERKAEQPPEPFRITYIRATPGAGTQLGGASSHIKGVTDAMLKLGAQLRVISNDELVSLDPAKTPLTVIGPETIGATRAAFDLRNSLIFSRGAVSEIEQDPPDFIYERYSRFGYAGVAASLRTRRPLFLEYNGSEVWVGRHWDQVGMLHLLARFERLNLAAAARIFVVSEVDRRNLLREGVSPAKIVVNPNGVDPDLFQPNIGGEQIRADLGVLPDERLVGFVGTFGPWHGVLALAEAIKLIPAALGIRFLLIGSGSLRAEAERLLKEEHHEQRVIFTGSVEHERVAAFLDGCDVLVSPHVPLADGSEFFGSPTKLFEYMAMGKGIVASRLGQIAEVLRHEETALLVEPGNAQQLADAIMRLAESRMLREQLGSAAREAAIRRHAWTRNAQNVLAAYRDWLEN